MSARVRLVYGKNVTETPFEEFCPVPQKLAAPTRKKPKKVRV